MKSISPVSSFVLGLSFAGALGCGASPQTKKAPSSQASSTPTSLFVATSLPALTPVKKTLVIGRTDVGDILYYGLSHASPFASVRKAESQERKRLIGRLNIKAVQDVQREKITDVFIEDLAFDLPPLPEGNRSREAILANIQLILDQEYKDNVERKALLQGQLSDSVALLLKAFPEGIPSGEPTVEQMEACYEVKYGGGLLLWMFDKNVSLHRTTTPAQWKDIDDQIRTQHTSEQGGLKWSEDVRFLFFEVREYNLSLAFTEFFAKPENRGRRVALFYGPAHFGKTLFEAYKKAFKDKDFALTPYFSFKCWQVDSKEELATQLNQLCQTQSK